MANLVDSKQQMLPVDQIVTVAVDNMNSKFPPEAVIQGITAEYKQPGALPMRYGNTLFLCHKGKDKTGFFRALNADTARNYVDNGNKWVKEAYEIGFDFMVTRFEDPTILSVFKAISRKPPRPNMGYQASKLKDGQIQVVLQLGPRRGKE